VRLKAVVFDLWETLIDWDEQAAAEMNARIDALTEPGFRDRWYAAPHRYTAPVRQVLADIGIPAEAMDDVCAVRSAFVRRCLVPRDGAVATLRTLRERGYKLGLITVCTEDVELLWPETEFAGLFDAEVFSNSFGVSKPDPRIYRRCCELLGVEPEEAVFVGDGANDELAGARRVGMEAILIHRDGEDPEWPELQEWDGPRVTSIPAVLNVLERL
jgi:putative hydrolase of the HAD superfamily